MQIGQQLPKLSGGLVKPENWNRLVDVVNVLRSISLGPGLSGSMGPGGVTLDTRASGQTADNTAWRITLAPGTATLYDGVWLRGGVTHFYDPISVELPDPVPGTDIYVAAHLEMTDNTASAVAGAETAVLDSAFDINSTLLKVPLYRLRATGSGYTVACDYRTLITGAVYGGG